MLRSQLRTFGPQGSSGLLANVVLGTKHINFGQTRGVHHHKEWEIDKRLYLGIIRSNGAKANRNTHVNEKRFRKMRAQKTVVIELPDDVEEREAKKFTPDEMRIHLLKKGINPYKDVMPREWQEHQITYNSFYKTLETFVGYNDSTTHKEGWITANKNRILDGVKNKYYNIQQGTRRIRKVDKGFNKSAFPEMAESVYISAFNALTKRDKKGLLDSVTESAFKKLWPDVENGTVVWELVNFIEKSKVVSIRSFDLPPQSGNEIAQITVKMHSKQKFAIYDRFGRLLLGSEDTPKDCLEYVVFENHIVDKDGKWRFHDKVYPHWMEPKEGINRPSLLEDGDRPTEPKILRASFSRHLKTAKKEIEKRKEKMKE